MSRLRWFAAATLAILTSGVGCGSRPGGVAAGHGMALPFIENDFPQALTRAREANLPLFVEVWAPW
jgi:hypothetical protein